MRLSFAVGGVGGLLSYILKHYCQETPIFAAHRHLARSHSLDKRAVAGAVLVLSFFIVSYSFIFILLPLVYQEEASGGATLQTLILYGALLLLAGWAADRWGMRTVMALGAALMALSAPLLARYCASLCLIQSVLTACASLVIGPIHGWMLHHFRPQERCRGIFISSAIATALFGGSTVPICLMLYEASHSPLLCSAYPAAVAACCFFYLFRRGA
jgi:MFS family permease